MKTLRGKDEWNTAIIASILSNEKYAGDVVYQKTFRADPISKRVVINRGQKEKYLVSNNHPAIIDRDTFMQAQAETARRAGKKRTSDLASTNLGKYSAKYALSEILVCGTCGSPYRRTTWTKKGHEKKVYWRCLSRIEHGKKFCRESPGVEEKKLQEAICRALQKGAGQSEEVYDLIKTNLSYAISGSSGEVNVFTINRSIEKKQKEVSEIIKSSMKPDANKELLDNEVARLYSEIAALQQQQKHAQQNMQDSIRDNEELSKAMKWLEESGTLFDRYDDVTVRRLVDMIRVNADRTITVYLKCNVVITESLKGEQVP